MLQSFRDISCLMGFGDITRCHTVLCTLTLESFVTQPSGLGQGHNDSRWGLCLVCSYLILNSQDLAYCYNHMADELIGAIDVAHVEELLDDGKHNVVCSPCPVKLEFQSLKYQHMPSPLTQMITKVCQIVLLPSKMSTCTNAYRAHSSAVPTPSLLSVRRSDKRESSRFTTPFR